MNRRVAAVLIGTCLALVAATVWVPKRDAGNYRLGPRTRLSGSRPWLVHEQVGEWGSDQRGPPFWTWVWDTRLQVAHLTSNEDHRFVCSPPGAVPMTGFVIDWRVAPIAPALIVVAGGLLALGLRTRAARGAA